MDKAQLDGQISFFNKVEKELEPPKLQVGQEVYLLDLDIVRAGRVQKMWPVKNRGYGYSVEMLQALEHETIWDWDIGRRCFNCRERADAIAESRREFLDRIQSNELQLSEQQSFEYLLDERTVIATYAKVGEDKLLWSDFFTYTFLDIFPNRRLRDKAYREHVGRASEEAERHHGKAVNYVPTESLYRVADEHQYASWRYARSRQIVSQTLLQYDVTQEADDEMGL